MNFICTRSGWLLNWMSWLDGSMGYQYPKARATGEHGPWGAWRAWVWRSSLRVRVTLTQSSIVQALVPVYSCSVECRRIDQWITSSSLISASSGTGRLAARLQYSYSYSNTLLCMYHRAQAYSHSHSLIRIMLKYESILTLKNHPLRSDALDKAPYITIAKT